MVNTEASSPRVAATTIERLAMTMCRPRSRYQEEIEMTKKAAISMEELVAWVNLLIA